MVAIVWEGRAWPSVCDLKLNLVQLDKDLKHTSKSTSKHLKKIKKSLTLENPLDVVKLKLFCREKLAKMAP